MLKSKSSHNGHSTNGHTNGRYVAPPTLGEEDRKIRVGQRADKSPSNGHTDKPRMRIDGIDGIDGFTGKVGGVGSNRFRSGQGRFWLTPKAGLLGKLVCYFADYLILPEHSLLVMSLWTLATYFMQRWDRFPHLALSSPDPRCGKTRALELLQFVCRNSWFLTSPTAAVLYRRIAQDCPTILYDEAQGLNRCDSENASLLNELFCSGISRDSCIPRCVGPDHEPHDFPIYCPKVIASVGKSRGMLADRCIHILFERKRKDEHTKRARLRDIEREGRGIAKEVAAWAKPAMLGKKVQKIYDRLELLDIDNDRMAELLLPLQSLLVTEFGEEESYPLTVFKKYAEGMEDMDREVQRLSPGVRLLTACKKIVEEQLKKKEKKLSFVSTTWLIDRLCERTDEPWADYKFGKPINPENLAGLFSEYGIKPKRNKEQTKRGYDIKDFHDAWDRYVAD